MARTGEEARGNRRKVTKALKMMRCHPGPDKNAAVVVVVAYLGDEGKRLVVNRLVLVVLMLEILE